MDQDSISSTDMEAFASVGALQEFTSDILEFVKNGDYVNVVLYCGHISYCIADLLKVSAQRFLNK